MTGHLLQYQPDTHTKGLNTLDRIKLATHANKYQSEHQIRPCNKMISHSSHIASRTCRAITMGRRQLVGIDVEFYVNAAAVHVCCQWI